MYFWKLRKLRNYQGPSYLIKFSLIGLRHLKWTNQHIQSSLNKFYKVTSYYDLYMFKIKVNILSLQDYKLLHQEFLGLNPLDSKRANMCGMRWQLLVHSYLHAILEVSYHHTTNVKKNLKISYCGLNFEN